jgi:hypothetical protein
MLWTSAFWKGLAERALKTWAQALAAYFIVGTTGLLDLDWVTALSVSGAAALASALTSIGNADFVAGPGEQYEPQHLADPTLRADPDGPHGI